MRSLPLTLATSAALVLASSPLRAGGVRIVEPTGMHNYPDIASAVAAAAEGDVLLVAPGIYAGFTISGKSLSIFKAGSGSVDVRGGVTISGLGSVQTVVIRGIALSNPQEVWSPELVISGCAGFVRLEDVTVKASDHTYDFCFSPHTLDPGVAGAWITSSSRVSLARCAFTGGTGMSLPSTEDPNCQPGMGGPGLQVGSSSVVLYDCTATGGLGGSGEYDYNVGGTGLSLSTSTVFASNCTIAGGGGGSGVSYTPGPHCWATGGVGCSMSGGTTLYQIGCTFQGGPQGGWPSCTGVGAPLVGGTPTSFSGPARRATITPAVGSDVSNWSVSFQGDSSDRAYLLQSASPGFVIAPVFSGAWLIDRSAIISATYLGMGASLSAVVPTEDLPAGSVFARRYVQIATRNSGSAFLGSGVTQLLLDRSSGPDCNGNGTNDFVEVIESTTPDVNRDLIPDPCQMAGPPWYVDDSAPPGGNGSAASPFQTIGQAFAAAYTGHSILVADGTYTGAGNRDLDFAGRNLVVRSQHGPANCVIDCQAAGRAFYVNGTVTSAGLIEGFTIRNGSQVYGGGIYIKAASPTIRNCNVVDCRAQQLGAGMFMEGSSSLVRDCAFTGNLVTGGIGDNGGGIHIFEGAPLIEYCYIAENQAPLGGGVAVIDATPANVPRLVACMILDNVASDPSGVASGGGIDASADDFTGVVYVTDCLIAGNRADYGGACRAGFGMELRIEDTTIVDNSATTEGGALLAAKSGQVNLSNCVLDGNSAPIGPQIALRTNYGAATLRSSDLRGGAATVSVCSNCTLTLGTGMIDADPLFADRDGPDNQLVTSGDNDYRLLAGSPCLDAGDNTLVPADSGDLDGDGNYGEFLPWDLDAVTRFIDDPAPDTGIGSAPIVDMGCYEHHP